MATPRRSRRFLAVCQFIGFSLVGVNVPALGTIRYGVVRSLAGAIVAWVLALVGAWVAAIVIEKLAPTFQSRGNTAQALKLVVYSMTPTWVAGVLNLVPALAVLGIIAALYALYVAYLGFPAVMGTPSEKVIPYMAVSAVVIIIVSLVIGAITAAVVGVGATTL